MQIINVVTVSDVAAGLEYILFTVKMCSSLLVIH